MNLPLRILLVLTLIACGYVMWRDVVSVEINKDDLVSAAMSSKRIDHPASTLSQVIEQPFLNLFPDQGKQHVAISEAPIAEVPVAVPPQPTLRKPTASRAPSIPFRVSGVWVDAGQRQIVLHNADQTFVLCQRCEVAGNLTIGDVIDHTYRIEKIENQRITLMYLPLQMKQTIDIDQAMSATGS